jgi:hypothetical protein
MDNRNFFVYARKSTESEDRQIRSIGDQLAELRELARRDGLTILDMLCLNPTDVRRMFGSAVSIVLIQDAGC